MRRAFSPKPFRIFRFSLGKLRRKSLQLPQPGRMQNHGSQSYGRQSHSELSKRPRCKPTWTEKRNLSRATVRDFFRVAEKNQVFGWSRMGLAFSDGEELRPRERKDR